MKKTAQIVLMFMMMLCSVTAWSGEISKGALDKLMALSGINKQVLEIPGAIVKGMEESSEQGSSVLPDDLYDELKKDMEKAFLPEEILKTINLEIKQNLSEAEVKNILDWYESDIGRKITKAEEAASTPAAHDEMMRNMDFLISDQERLALAERIEKTLPATDMVMRINENTAMAVFTAFSSIQEPAQRQDVKSFKAELSEQMQENRSHIREMIVVSNIFSYKDIDKAGIEKYIKFLESPAAQKFNKTAMNGMEKAFKQSNEKLTKSLAAVVKKYNESIKKQPKTEIKNNDSKKEDKESIQ